MKDRVLLGLIIGLAALGAAVDFTSAVLSFLGDSLFSGGVVLIAYRLYVSNQELRKENAQLQDWKRILDRNRKATVPAALDKDGHW